MSTIPGCINSDRPKCGRIVHTSNVRSVWNALTPPDHVYFSSRVQADDWCHIAIAAFDGDVENAKLALERCFTRKDSMHARTVAAEIALIKMGSNDAGVALLKCSGQTRLCCDVAPIHRPPNAISR